MRPLTNALFLCGAALFVAACSSSPTKPQASRTAEPQAARIQIQQDPGGFSIIEEVNVDAAIRAQYESAIRLLEQKQTEQGIAMLVKVTEAAPGVTAAHIDLGIAYARAGDLKRAESSLLQAIALNPRHPIAHNELGMVKRRQGEFAAARASSSATGRRTAWRAAWASPSHGTSTESPASRPSTADLLGLVLPVCRGPQLVIRSHCASPARMAKWRCKTMS